MSVFLIIVSLCLLHSSASTGGDRRRNPEKFIFDQEAIVTRLESVLAELAKQNEAIDDLRGKLQLSEKLVKEQDAEIADLKQSIDNLNDEANPGGTRSSIVRKESVSLRSCHEIRSNDPESPSGMYWVDPDGFGSGDLPIFVFCDMTTGSTLVPHDSEFPIEVDHCLDPGCSARIINYNATLRQLVALTQISETCRQFVQFDCMGVALEHDGIAQSWWTDRQGKPQYHWAGTQSEHTCQCGIDGSCDNSSFKCNCDALADREHTDEGYITNKEILPITQVNIGRITAQSYARYALGRLECSGQVNFNAEPESCSDLWKLGHSLNGFYDVRKLNDIVKVFCDFSQLPSVTGVEKRTGAVDGKSPVYFYVQRNGPLAGTASTIPFDVERLNLGDAMNMKSGTFTAPRSGIYTFDFNAVKKNNNVPAHVTLRRNDVVVGSAWGSSVPNFFSMSISSTLQLKAGDEIKLVLERGSLHDDKSHFTHFTGKLLQEESLV